MRIILLKDIENLGREGDIKEVKNGYARNFLIPRGLAIKASAAAQKQAEERRRAKERQEAQRRRVLEEYASRISALQMKATLKVGKKGKIFGSIDKEEVCQFLAEQGIPIEKSQILQEEPIKKIGSHSIKIKLAADLVAELKITIEPESSA